MMKTIWAKLQFKVLPSSITGLPLFSICFISSSKYLAIKTLLLASSILLVSTSGYASDNHINYDVNHKSDLNKDTKEQLLIKDNKLSYQQVFEQALKHAPQTAISSAREQQANAYQHYANSWMSTSPKVYLNMTDDRPFEDLGETELEAGFEFELKTGSTKKQNKSLSRTYQQQSLDWQSLFQWQIAGRLRQLFADMNEAELRLSQAITAKNQAQQLNDIVAIMLTAGDVPKRNLLQTQSILLEQEISVLHAHRALVDAERQYSNLTGLTYRPQSNYLETPVGSSYINKDHILLRFLQSSVDLSREKVSQIKQQAQGNPSLSLGIRHQRANELEDYNDSLAIGFSIPFGGKHFISTQSSDAVRQQVEAEVNYQHAYRDLKQQFHEIKHELKVIVTEIQLKKQQALLAQQQFKMTQTAFEMGEATLADVIKAMQQHQSAESNYQLAQFKQQRLISEFNHVLGVTL